jgi:hypothetical protein
VRLGAEMRPAANYCIATNDANRPTADVYSSPWETAYVTFVFIDYMIVCVFYMIVYVFAFINAAGMIAMYFISQLLPLLSISQMWTFSIIMSVRQFYSSASLARYLTMPMAD